MFGSLCALKDIDSYLPLAFVFTWFRLYPCSKPAPSWADRMEQDEASKVSPGELH